MPIRSGYSDEEYDEFVSALVHLSLKYPKVVATERWNLFLHSTGMTGNVTMNAADAINAFNEENINTFTAGSNWVGIRPVSVPVRSRLINILCGWTMAGEQVGLYQRLIWNAIIPLVFLLYGWVKSIASKNMYAWLLLTALLIRVPIVALAQPSNWIMYFLSFYLCGYAFLVYWIWFICSRNNVRDKE
jgi:hypothetical protein